MELCNCLTPLTTPCEYCMALSESTVLKGLGERVDLIADHAVDPKTLAKTIQETMEEAFESQEFDDKVDERIDSKLDDVLESEEFSKAIDKALETAIEESGLQTEDDLEKKIEDALDGRALVTEADLEGAKRALDDEDESLAERIEDLDTQVAQLQEWHNQWATTSRSFWSRLKWVFRGPATPVVALRARKAYGKSRR